MFHILPITDELFVESIRPKLHKNYAETRAEYWLLQPTHTHACFVDQWLVKMGSEKELLDFCCEKMDDFRMSHHATGIITDH